MPGAESAELQGEDSDDDDTAGGFVITDTCTESDADDE